MYGQLYIWSFIYCSFWASKDRSSTLSTSCYIVIEVFQVERDAAGKHNRLYREMTEASLLGINRWNMLMITFTLGKWGWSDKANNFYKQYQRQYIVIIKMRVCDPLEVRRSCA